MASSLNVRLTHDQVSLTSRLNSYRRKTWSNAGILRLERIEAAAWAAVFSATVEVRCKKLPPAQYFPHEKESLRCVSMRPDANDVIRARVADIYRRPDGPTGHSVIEFERLNLDNFHEVGNRVVTDIIMLRAPTRALKMAITWLCNDRFEVELTGAPKSFTYRVDRERLTVTQISCEMLSCLSALRVHFQDFASEDLIAKKTDSCEVMVPLKSDSYPDYALKGSTLQVTYNAGADEEKEVQFFLIEGSTSPEGSCNIVEEPYLTLAISSDPGQAAILVSPNGRQIAILRQKVWASRSGPLRRIHQTVSVSMYVVSDMAFSYTKFFRCRTLNQAADEHNVRLPLRLLFESAFFTNNGNHIVFLFRGEELPLIIRSSDGFIVAQPPTESSADLFFERAKVIVQIDLHVIQLIRRDIFIYDARDTKLKTRVFLPQGYVDRPEFGVVRDDTEIDVLLVNGPDRSTRLLPIHDGSVMHEEI